MTNGDLANGPDNDQTLREQGELIGYSYATGKKKKKKTGAAGLLAGFRANRDVKNKQKAAEARNSASAIKALNKPDKPLILPKLPKDSSKGMSKGVKIAIGVGIAAVVIIGGYFAYKKFGKHGKK